MTADDETADAGHEPARCRVLPELPEPTTGSGLCKLPVRDQSGSSCTLGSRYVKSMNFIPASSVE